MPDGPMTLVRVLDVDGELVAYFEFPAGSEWTIDLIEIAHNQDGLCVPHRVEVREAP